jgi:hypothetical protein
MIDSRNFHDSVRRAGLSVVVIAAGIVWALCLPYQASAQGGFDGPGRYEIANLKSGKVLDMDRNAAPLRWKLPRGRAPDRFSTPSPHPRGSPRQPRGPEVERHSRLGHDLAWLRKMNRHPEKRIGAPSFSRHNCSPSMPFRRSTDGFIAPVGARWGRAC